MYSFFGAKALDIVRFSSSWHTGSCEYKTGGLLSINILSEEFRCMKDLLKL